MKYVVEILFTLHTDQPDFAAALEFAKAQVHSAANCNGEVDPQSLKTVELLDVSKV
jgi:hypothetical protein